MNNKDKFIWLLVGGGLALVGVVFLVINLGNILARSWWILVLLGISAGCLFFAWTGYKKGTPIGSLSVVVPGGIGIILLIVFLAYLVTFSWGIIWPALLTLAGIGIILYVTGKKPSEIVSIVKDQLDGDNTAPKA